VRYLYHGAQPATFPELVMIAFTAWLTIIAIAFGLAKGGFLGALTGLVIGLLTGSSVSVLLGRAEGLLPARSVAGFGQRLAGAAMILLVPIAAHQGRWTWGWAWALGLFVLLAVVLFAAVKGIDWLKLNAKAAKQVELTLAGAAADVRGQNTPTPQRSGVEVGTCEHCAGQFRFSIVASHMADASYAYCSDCGTVAVLQPHDAEAPTGFATMGGPILRENETLLTPCRCGGRFVSRGAPRCPNCRRVIDAEYATDFIEASTPFASRGWWQRTWHGPMFMIINEESRWNDWHSPVDSQR
jgi:hypothetical protein